MSYFRPDIEAMEGYTPGYQPKGPGWTKLNTNENPYPPSPRVLAAIRDAAGEDLRKYPDPMADTFREAAAELLGTSPDCILCGNGSDDLLNMAMRAFCAQGDPVAFPYPTYSLYVTLARIQGARPVKIEFPEDYSLPAELATTGAPLTLLCNPNAPSGTAVCPEEVARLAHHLDGVLVVDEAYVDFADADCMELHQRLDNVIVMRTMSKSYSLAGLRFGYAAANPRLIEGLAKVKDSYNVDSLAIAGATAAIRDQSYLHENIKRIRETRRHLIAALQDLGFECYPSQTNFVLARPPEPFEAGQLFQELFDRKILVRYFDEPRLDEWLRITVGSEDEIETLLSTLRSIIAAARTGGE
jgi:histidinol-phosphate aminotransferase